MVKWSDDPSSNPADIHSFYLKRTKIKQKRGREWPIYKQKQRRKYNLEKIRHLGRYLVSISRSIGVPT